MPQRGGFKPRGFESQRVHTCFTTRVVYAFYLLLAWGCLELQTARLELPREPDRTSHRGAARNKLVLLQLTLDSRCCEP